MLSSKKKVPSLKLNLDFCREREFNGGMGEPRREGEGLTMVSWDGKRLGELGREVFDLKIRSGKLETRYGGEDKVKILFFHGFNQGFREGYDKQLGQSGNLDRGVRMVPDYKPVDGADVVVIPEISYQAVLGEAVGEVFGSMATSKLKNLDPMFGLLGEKRKEMGESNPEILRAFDTIFEGFVEQYKYNR